MPSRAARACAPRSFAPRATAPRHRPRARRRRPARRHLRGRRAAGARRFARRPRPQRPRRLRRRVVRRLRRRRARQRHLAGADVPAVHRRRRRRGAEARDLPRPRSASSAAAPRRCPRSRARHRAVPARLRSIAACMESFATLAHAIPTGVFDNRAIDDFLARLFAAPRPHQRLPQAAAQAVPGRDQSRHRRVGDVRRARAATTCRSRARSRRRARCRACSRRWRSTASTTSTAR